jgi:hypothetical protein
VLGDQIRSRVKRVPARAVERYGSFQPGRGLIEELRPLRSAKRELFEIGQQALRRPRLSSCPRNPVPPG